MNPHTRTNLAWAGLLLVWLLSTILTVRYHLVLGSATFVIGGTLIAIIEKRGFDQFSRH